MGMEWVKVNDTGHTPLLEDDTAECMIPAENFEFTGSFDKSGGDDDLGGGDRQPLLDEESPKIWLKLYEGMKEQQIEQCLDVHSKLFSTKFCLKVNDENEPGRTRSYHIQTYQDNIVTFLTYVNSSVQ